MKSSYWLLLAGFVSLMVIIGLASRFVSFGSKSEPLTCKAMNPRPHPFLCGEKMAIRDARVADLRVVDGISLKKARAIEEFFDQGVYSIDDVVHLKGIGPKTLAHLKIHFF